MPKDKRMTAFRNADFARERMRRALCHLATSRDKLRERVLDAYRDHVSHVSPTPKFFPDRETLSDIKTIRDTIQTVREKIEMNPGPYERLLRLGVKNSMEIARSTLDYRIARKLATLITELYFKLQDGLEREYKDDLRKHAPKQSPEEISAEMSRRLKWIQRQKTRAAKRKSWTTVHVMNGREYIEREQARRLQEQVGGRRILITR